MKFLARFDAFGHTDTSTAIFFVAFVAGCIAYFVTWAMKA